MPLVQFAEVENSDCIERFWARTHLHCQVFLGFIKGSQFNDWQQKWPESQEGGGKCSVQETHRTLFWENGKQANYCQGLGKLRIFYFLYPCFPATCIPSIHLVNVVFSFDVYALFFNALTQCFQMEMRVAFLKNLGKIFFPNFLGEDKPVKLALNGNFVKPGTPLCFITSGSKVPATQLWVILRKRLSYAIWEKWYVVM